MASHRQDDGGGGGEMTPEEFCTCGYDLNITGHCGGCNKIFATCLGCRLPKKWNRCVCIVKKRHPDYPEEWL